MAISCYAAMTTKSALQPFTYEPKLLAGDEIEVTITHCGICHSDIHLIDNDWGISKYPLVPGHEIIGVINDVGENVTHLKKGQRVGIGWQSYSCGECEWCKQGKENQCSKQKATCVNQYGGFSNGIRVHSHFAFTIPQGLESATAAPLLCGGITVYSPLKQYITHPGMRVSIIGIGGLGHLALQFAKALGCVVTALSTSPNKQEQAKQFGADKFVDINDKKAMAQLANTQDLVISTVTAPINWQLFVNMLRPFGTLCVVGAATKELEVSLMSLIMGRRSVCGSNIGSCAEIKEMLDFAVEKGIRAQVECMPMTEVNAALEKVRSNQARYRMVLEV